MASCPLRQGLASISVLCSSCQPSSSVAPGSEQVGSSSPSCEVQKTVPRLRDSCSPRSPPSSADESGQQRLSSQLHPLGSGARWKGREALALTPALTERGGRVTTRQMARVGGAALLSCSAVVRDSGCGRRHFPSPASLSPLQLSVFLHSRSAFSEFQEIPQRPLGVRLQG
ncbi:unnamed protein product [Rangifer tarandus platyrhynchus]|uniref:Uncharacterized protein n=1 Tax=Rangifer tarandus platyrhynchus TaxID=3082113 RepID=A0AC60A7I2_RANTA